MRTTVTVVPATTAAVQGQPCVHDFTSEEAGSGSPSTAPIWIDDERLTNSDQELNVTPASLEDMFCADQGEPDEHHDCRAWGGTDCSHRFR